MGTMAGIIKVPYPRYEIYHRWRLIKDAKLLAGMTRRRRNQIWGDWKLQYRVRYTPKSKEERPTLIVPLIHKVKLYSETLDKSITLEVTRRALRQIDEAGGLDNFLLGTPENKLFSDVASKLKFQVQLKRVEKEYQEFLQNKKRIEQERLRRMVQMIERA